MAVDMTKGLDPKVHPIKLILDVTQSIRDLFPHLPFNEHHWKLRVPPLRPQQAQLLVQLDPIIHLVLSFEALVTIGCLRVPASLVTSGLPVDADGATERMALRNDCPSDIMGWLFLIKTTYEDHYQPPLRFKVIKTPAEGSRLATMITTKAIVLADERKGQDATFRLGDLVEVHPSLKGIRNVASTPDRRPTPIHDWSWTHIDNGHTLIDSYLKALPPVVVHRYKVAKRYGLMLEDGTPMNVSKGEVLFARSDGSAYTGPQKLDDASYKVWLDLNTEGSSGTLKHALASGALTLEDYDA